jgi:hypothetical protein
MSALPIMTELGRGLGWHARTVLVMLWMYLDESGEHDRSSGRLKGLALAGGIALFPSWEALSIEWTSILESFGISMFHMADFEARAKPFKEWPEDRRRGLLSGLLDIAVRHVPIFFGTIDQSDKPGFRQRYIANLAKMTKEMWIASRHSSEPLTVVIAAHKEIKAELMGWAFDLWSQDSDLRFGGFADPTSVCPLQVADIVAYEFCRAARTEKRQRYPLTRLKEAKICCLLAAETLGVVNL